MMLDAGQFGGLIVFLITVTLWLTEALPLPVTGLLVPVLISLLGVLSPKEAFAPFGSDILFLFLGCFLLSRALEKHGLDRRVAYRLLALPQMKGSLFRVFVILAGVSFFLSMWISNTSATAIMVAITLGVQRVLADQLPDQETLRRYTAKFLLATAFAASVGGLATPIGSPPNLIAIELLREKGIDLNFFQWMVFALPLSLLLLIVVLIVLEIRYPSHGLQVRGLAQAMKEALKALGPLRSSEKLLGWIFALTIVCWIVPGFVLGIFPEIEGVRTLNERLSLSAVGLFSGLLLFVLPLGGANKLLDWADARSVDWGTLMLFGGGLALGEMIEKTGLASLLGSFVFGGFVAQPVLLVVAVVILSLLFSEFASNTASAAVIIPMLIGISGGSTDSLQWLVIAATCGASLGFMLPVSTPPNAIVYSSGRVSAREMLTSGVWLDVIGALVVILFVTGLLYNL